MRSIAPIPFTYYYYYLRQDTTRYTNNVPSFIDRPVSFAYVTNKHQNEIYYQLRFLDTAREIFVDSDSFHKMRDGGTNLTDEQGRIVNSKFVLSANGSLIVRRYSVVASNSRYPLYTGSYQQQRRELEQTQTKAAENQQRLEEKQRELQRKEELFLQKQQELESLQQGLEERQRELQRQEGLFLQKQQESESLQQGLEVEKGKSANLAAEPAKKDESEAEWMKSLRQQITDITQAKEELLELRTDFTQEFTISEHKRIQLEEQLLELQQELKKHSEQQEKSAVLGQNAVRISRRSQPPGVRSESGKTTGLARETVISYHAGPLDTSPLKRLIDVRSRRNGGHGVSRGRSRSFNDLEGAGVLGGAAGGRSADRFEVGAAFGEEDESSQSSSVGSIIGRRRSSIESTSSRIFDEEESQSYVIFKRSPEKSCYHSYHEAERQSNYRVEKSSDLYREYLNEKGNEAYEEVDGKIKSKVMDRLADKIMSKAIESSFQKHFLNNQRRSESDDSANLLEYSNIAKFSGGYSRFDSNGKIEYKPSNIQLAERRKVMQSLNKVNEGNIKKLQKFSADVQGYCERYGLCSGRENQAMRDNPVGLRLCYASDNAIKQAMDNIMQKNDADCSRPGLSPARPTAGLGRKRRRTSSASSVGEVGFPGNSGR